MPARHVLSFAKSAQAGGVERALWRLAAGWAAAGRRVTLAVRDADAEPPPGVELVRLRSWLDLAPLVRRVAPDLIFCAGNSYTAAAALTRWRLGSRAPPVVGKLSNAVRRGDHGPVMDRLHAAWLRRHGRFLDHLVAMTPASAAEAETALGMAGRVSVIPNPPNPPLSGARAPLPPGRVVLGVGRLAPQKRWDRLVDALPGLPADVRVVVLGEGPERRRLERRARVLGVADRLHLPGAVPCPFPAMRAAALLALPSDYEGTPGVLREALSVGCPVVATEAGVAVREVVYDLSLGEVVARGDAAALLGALRRTLAMPRPRPVPQPGGDSAERYLELFDRLTA